MTPLGSGPDPRPAAHNPFAAPRAPVDDPRPVGPGILLDKPRKLESGRGFGWLGEGWALFREAPGTWIGIVLVWTVMGLVVALVPGLNFASTLFNTVLTGGLMFGCHSLAAGRGLAFDHLFEGFRREFGSLVLVGLLGLAAIAGVVGVGFLGVLGAGALGLSLTQEAVDVAGLLVVLLAALVVVSLMIPISMALWFAPALVILHGQPATRAMALSFRGCLRNMLPFLMYGVGMLGLGVLASLPLFLGWLVLGPVLVASLYAAYRDIFVA